MGGQTRLVSWNVNGIRAGIKKGFFDWLASDNADVVCLQETKIAAHQLTDEMKTPPGGYHTFWSHAERPGYSGVAVFTKTEPLSVRYGFGDPRFDCEGRTLILEFEDYYLFNHYYPNGASGDQRLAYKLAFYDAWLAHVLPYRETGKALVITGDFNTAHKPIDIARPKENEGISGFLPIERAWMDQFVASGFVDTFRLKYPEEANRYSWWNMRARARERNVGWRIDYFFVDDTHAHRVVEADIHQQVMGSDHCPVSLVIRHG